MVEEIICASNMSFGMYPGLTHGAYNAIQHYGTPEMKQLYLPKMVEGVWSGTMCLTEPHCGTDLGLLRTKAEPQADGTYKVTGTKIFITSGEHDLTENILHLVLARLPDAPAGIKGISLFLVPKFLVNADASLGARNPAVCGAIEHKMGIKASSTCVMNFDAATGYLVGTPHKGMQAMFVMMNAARLGVGMQGLGISEVAYQNAVIYAKERLQGRSLKGAAEPDKPADPLIVHPDIRRMLLTMRAYTEGNRMLAVWMARQLDISLCATDPAQKQVAEDFVALMTPIVKAFMTDCGSEIANLGMQVYGGHGFIREWGMEQFVRDARISQIYEGTNGVQALDLVGRKLPAHMGRNLRPFFHEVANYLAAKQADTRPEVQPYVQGLAKAFGRLQTVTGWIAEKGLSNPEEGGGAATDYLRLFALVTLAYLWLRAIDIAIEKRSGDEALFYQAKMDTARFYFERLLPQTGALMSTIMSGCASLMNFNAEAF
jgi:alkylation response protein AidB-like acyl-CoA dehydrogenase